MAGCDKTAKCWDLATNQSVQVAAHDAPIRTCHWIKASTYSCLMTGSWDKTLRVIFNFQFYFIFMLYFTSYQIFVCLLVHQFSYSEFDHLS